MKLNSAHLCQSNLKLLLLTCSIRWTPNSSCGCMAPSCGHWGRWSTLQRWWEFISAPSGPNRCKTQRTGEIRYFVCLFAGNDAYLSSLYVLFLMKLDMRTSYLWFIIPNQPINFILWLKQFVLVPTPHSSNLKTNFGWNWKTKLGATQHIHSSCVYTLKHVEQVLQLKLIIAVSKELIAQVELNEKINIL